jgi:hypothetical protein
MKFLSSQSGGEHEANVKKLHPKEGTPKKISPDHVPKHFWHLAFGLDDDSLRSCPPLN